MTVRTLAFVGAAGGVGTTRLTVECGATVARAGLDVAIFDAAFATQGLASYIDAPIDVEVTTLATEEGRLKDGLYPLNLDTEGTLSICPARGPFARTSRAQTAGAAERFEQHLAAAALSHDAVFVDVPPINSNQALAAINSADRVSLVTTGTERGASSVATMHDRLADIGAQADFVVANRTKDGGRIDADVAIPESAVQNERDSPAVVDPDDSFAPAVADMAEALLDTSLDLDFPDGSRFGGLLGSDA